MIAILAELCIVYLISFLTMPARRDRRAIHDLAADTIAVEASAPR